MLAKSEVSLKMGDMSYYYEKVARMAYYKAEKKDTRTVNVFIGISINYFME